MCVLHIDIFHKEKITASKVPTYTEARLWWLTASKPLQIRAQVHHDFLADFSTCFYYRFFLNCHFRERQLRSNSASYIRRVPFMERAHLPEHNGMYGLKHEYPYESTYCNTLKGVTCIAKSLLFFLTLQLLPTRHSNAPYP